jgi:hypothetical protein
MTWAMRMAGADDEDPMNDDPEHNYAHEEELREEAEHNPLGGADVDHCQRIRD